MQKIHENPCFSVGQSEIVDNYVVRRTTIATKNKNPKLQVLSEM